MTLWHVLDGHKKIINNSIIHMNEINLITKKLTRNLRKRSLMDSSHESGFVWCSKFVSAGNSSCNEIIMRHFFKFFGDSKKERALGKLAECIFHEQIRRPGCYTSAHGFKEVRLHLITIRMHAWGACMLHTSDTLLDHCFPYSSVQMHVRHKWEWRKKIYLHPYILI
jgi:hypothetical protein